MRIISVSIALQFYHFYLYGKLINMQKFIIDIIKNNNDCKIGKSTKVINKIIDNVILI